MKRIILLLIINFSISLNAQWTNDPTVNMALSDTTVNESHLNPKSVSDGNGGAIIVWSHTGIYILGNLLSINIPGTS